MDSESLSTVEIAEFIIDDFPNEKIVYAKFLDDNDPRLIFVVTQFEPRQTTYMKVLKVEKSGQYRGFSTFESQPFAQLQRDIIQSQQPQDPMAESLSNNVLYNQYGNLKATVKFNE